MSFQGVLVQLNTGDADQLLRWIEKNSAWWTGRNPSSWSKELRVLEQSMEESNGWAHVGSRCTPRHTHQKCTHTCYLTIRSVDPLTLDTGVPAAGLSLHWSHESLAQAGGLGLPRAPTIHSPRLVYSACPQSVSHSVRLVSMACCWSYEPLTRAGGLDLSPACQPLTQASRLDQPPGCQPLT